MPRRPRTSAIPAYFHVINRAAAKAPLFVKPRDYRGFLQILREGLKLQPVPLISYCILGNHWHLVVGPTGTERLSLLMHWVATTHAVRFRLKHKTVGQGPVYQGRFKSKALEDGGAIIRTCRYVERNALAAGLVRRAQDWPWGSLADRRRDDPIVPLKDAQFLTSDSWMEFVNQPRVTDPRTQDSEPSADLSDETLSGEQTRIKPTPMLKARNISASSSRPAR